MDSLIVACSGTTDPADSGITGSKQEAFEVNMKGKYLACLFLNGTNNVCYHTLKIHLNNQFLITYEKVWITSTLRVLISEQKDELRAKKFKQQRVEVASVPGKYENDKN